MNLLVSVEVSPSIGELLGGGEVAAVPIAPKSVGGALVVEAPVSSSIV